MKVDKKAIPKYILPIIIHLKYKNIDSLKGWGKVDYTILIKRNLE